MVNPEEFRKGLRSFTTGVTVVTVPDGKGGMHAMTASSFASVSVVPQLASVNICKASKAHDLLMRASSYGINFLCEDQAPLANYFANRLPERREIDHIWVDGTPLLTGTMGWFACKRWAAYDGGEHTIFVGEALALHRTERAPLVCSRGRFHSLGPKLATNLIPKSEEIVHAALNQA
jgi:flavin reductase (DIM6/NTAB) family NADH-FMN oxidoreductase RutF